MTSHTPEIYVYGKCIPTVQRRVYRMRAAAASSEAFFLRLLEFATHAIIIMISSNDELGTSPRFIYTYTHTITYSNNNHKCYIINNERVVSSHTMRATGRSENRKKNVRGQCKVDTDRLSRVTDLLPCRRSFNFQFKRLDVV